MKTSASRLFLWTRLPVLILILLLIPTAALAYEGDGLAPDFTYGPYNLVDAISQWCQWNSGSEQCFDVPPNPPTVRWTNGCKQVRLAYDAAQAFDGLLTIYGYFDGPSQANEDLRATVNGVSSDWYDTGVGPGWYAVTLPATYHFNAGANDIYLTHPQYPYPQDCEYWGSIHFTDPTETETGWFALGDPVPDPPPLAAPANGSQYCAPEHPNVTLSWTCSGNECYAELATDSGFTSVIAATGWTAATSWDVTSWVQTGGTYWWRVKASNSGYEGAYSTARSFTVVTPTYVSGTITSNTTWPYHFCPYYELTDDVIIAPGVTLAIEPGAVVMGRSGTELRTEGHLSAVGTAALPILFTSATDSGPYEWSGLVFDGGTGDLEHVTVRYGGYTNSVFGLYYEYGANITARNVPAGQLRIASSQVLSSSAYVFGYGLYAADSHVIVSDTLFSGNGSRTFDYALYATGASTAITVTGATFQDNPGYAMRVEADDAHRLTGNTFAGNGYNRIRIAAGTLAPDATLTDQTGLDGYQLEGDVTVPTNGDLIMAPGTTIMGESYTELLVLGHLVAVGTVGQPIVFTSATDSGPYEWSGLVFDGGTGDLEHVTVRYGGYTNSVFGLYYEYGANVTARNVPAGQLRIASSQVLSSSAYVFGYGLYAADSHVIVSDTLFSGNGSRTSDYALYATGASTAITVTGATFQDNPGYAMRVEADDAHRLTGNTFAGNGYNRIRIAAGTLAPDATLTDQTGLDGYQLEGDVTVPTNGDLIMAPGTTIMGESYTELLVLGHLVAVGTVGQPIVFTSATDSGPYEWSGLVFDGGTGDLEHVTVRYGGYTNSVFGLYYEYGANITARNVPAGQLRIASSQVLSSSAYVFGYGLYAADSHVIVSDTLFSGNGSRTSDYALYATGASTAITVTGATFQDNPGYAMRVEADDAHRLTGNTFAGNGYNRIRIAAGTLAPDATLTDQTGLDGYQLEGDVTVPTNGDLIMAPGTTIMGESYTEFLVLGHLVAVGTVGQPIVFTSATDSGPYEWSGLVFDGGTGDLEHVTVRYGGYTNSVFGLYYEYGANITARNVPAGQLRIASSQVLSSSAYSFSYGLYAADSHVIVSDTLFSGNGYSTSSYALYATGASTAITVTGATFQNNAGYALGLQGGQTRLACSTVQNNSGDGIYLAGGSLAIVGTGISGNAGYGLRNVSGVQVDARYNWWGDASGPTHASNPGGAGDEVSDDVLFSPWYAAMPAGCQGGAVTPQATIAIVGGDDLELTWGHAPQHIRYEVWRSTDPYFQPGDGISVKQADLLPPSNGNAVLDVTTYLEEDVIAPDQPGYYYIVLAFDFTGQSSLPSNRVGVTSYTLTAGAR